MSMRHFIDITDLSVEEVNQTIALADAIIAQPDQYRIRMVGKKLATLFFEPSTRTRLSFEAAMMELGGNVLGFSSSDSSSAAKGESVRDTIRTVSCYADIAAIRHPKEGAPLAAAEVSDIPVVNAGDGGHNHPTQTLTDLLTIHREKGRLQDMVIGVCGDLKFGRTVHSLLTAMSRYAGNSIIMISPLELSVPSYIKEELKKNGISFKEVTDLDEVISKLDMLYMTRVQRERFFNEADYLRLKDSCILNMDKLARSKKDLIIMHPLPRVNEIARQVDDDPRACYFKQVRYGKFIRMALIIKLLEGF